MISNKVIYDYEKKGFSLNGYVALVFIIASNIGCITWAGNIQARLILS